MNLKHKKLMPMSWIAIARIDQGSFTHSMEIKSADHTFQATFEFPDGDVWIEPVPLSIKHYRLKMRIGEFEHSANFEDELGHFAQCVSESVHFFVKLHMGNFVFLLQAMTECMVYFGKVYGRITVDEQKRIWPTKAN